MKHNVIDRRSVLGTLAGAALLSGSRRSRAADDIPVFRRGINVSHALGWADVEANGGYGEAPFSAPRFLLDIEQRQAIRAAGFDFVRLVVDVGPFIASEGARRDDLDDLLIETVKHLFDADLGVVVDLHPSEMNPLYRPAELTRGVGTPKFQSLLALQRRLAMRLEQIVNERRTRSPPRIALELMNEPEMTPAAWQPMLEAAYKAARSGSATLPLVIGGGSMNAAAALMAIDMAPFAGDPLLIYTFHDYSPWQFTHQGLRGSPAYALDEIAYPAPGSAQGMQQATERRMATLELAVAERDHAQQARRSLISYANSHFDRSTLEQTFRQLTAWRETRRLPAHAVLLGEFGVHLTPYQRKPAGSAAREHWLRDIRELAEQHGFVWACWTYAGPGGFALAENEVGPGFDAATCRALGLTSV